MNGESYEWWAAQVAAAETDDENETTGDLTPLDNEAYRRDFPEIEYNRWEDDGGVVVDVAKFPDEPRTITVRAPNGDKRKLTYGNRNPKPRKE